MNDKIREYAINYATQFFKETIKFAQENKMPPGDMLAVLFRTIRMCQTSAFCLMADYREDNHVASIYGDMKELSLCALDDLIKRPETFLHFSITAKVGEEPNRSLLDTMKLFEELRDCKRN